AQQRTAAQQFSSASVQRNQLETAAKFPGVGRTRESFYVAPGGSSGVRLSSGSYRGSSSPSSFSSAAPSHTPIAPAYRGGRFSGGGPSSGGVSGGGGRPSCRGRRGVRAGA